MWAPCRARLCLGRRSYMVLWKTRWRGAVSPARRWRPTRCASFAVEGTGSGDRIRQARLGSV